MSYIYVIGSPQEGKKCKIGISDNPDQRLKQIQTGNPDQLQIYKIWETDTRRKAELLEAQIHKEMKWSRMKGEWFNVAPDDAIAEVDFAFIRWDDDPLLGKKY